MRHTLRLSRVRQASRRRSFWPSCLLNRHFFGFTPVAICERSHVLVTAHYFVYRFAFRCQPLKFVQIYVTPALIRSKEATYPADGARFGRHCDANLLRSAAGYYHLSLPELELHSAPLKGGVGLRWQP